MMKYFIVLSIIFASTLQTRAQLENNNWMVHGRIGLRFLPEFSTYFIRTNPRPFTSECVTTFSDPVKGNIIFFQGVISRSENENAMYITKPINSTIRNKDYEKIPSRKYGLNYLMHGNYTTSQAFMTLPSNYECGKYLLISVVGWEESFAAPEDKEEEKQYRGTLCYNVLDMKQNNGKGRVENPLNSIIVKDGLSEGLTATIHANGKDYWILTTLMYGNYDFIAIPVINDVPDTNKKVINPDPIFKGSIGNRITLSPNSKYLYAGPGFSYGDRAMHIYQFDNSTGTVLPIIKLDTLKNKDKEPLSSYKATFYDGAFSQNSRFLYITIRNATIQNNGFHNYLLQIDLQKKEYQFITLPNDYDSNIGFISLAPDGYMYFYNFYNKRFRVHRILESNTENPTFENVANIDIHDLEYAQPNFPQPNFSHHVFDPNYKRVPTLCDLPKMLPFDTSICVSEWLTLSPKFESLPTMNFWQWDAKNAEIKTGNDSLFTTRFLSTGIFPVRFIGCNANGCDTNSIQVTVYEKPTILRSPDYTLCPGESVRIGRMNTPVFEYSWSPPDYLDNPNSATPLCTPQKNMQYILTVKNTNGCINYDTVNITLGGELSVFAGADTTICKGETLQLSASGAENFSWIPTTGLSDPNSANPLFTGTSTTQYIVTGRSGNCEGKDTIIITVNEKPTLLVSENREICAGDTVHLSASGASEYSWSPAEGLNNPTIANPIFSGTKTTEYTVTGKNGTCTDSKKVLITVNNKPILSVSENREICAGDTVHLSANGASEYVWSPAEGLNNPTIANPIFSGTKTTEYTVTGKIGNCSDSKKVIVTVNDKPTLSASENREICLGDTVHLSASGADNYVWTPSTHLNNPFIANPIAQPTENITYTVRGTNSTGCFEEKTISIMLKNEEEKIISLDISDTIRYAPGTFVPVTIRIPAGISQATMSINYDPCCVKCDSNFIPNNNISTISLDKKSVRFTVISPNKQEREIILPCMIYLPPDGRKTEKFSISDIIHSEQCLIVRGINDEILYDPSCAWQFRGVQGTGRFGIESDGTNARLYTGYGGNISLKIYDITGIEVWNYSSYYQSTDIQEIQLPTLSHGLYIMQASNGVWHDECVMMK